MSTSAPAFADRVTAIVVAFDSAVPLADCLASLAAEGVPAIVVDNASEDDSRSVAAAHGARVVANAKNEGFGRAMNIGVAHATTPLVLLVNPDLTFEPGAVATLLAAAEAYPDAAILAPRIVEPDGRHFFAMRSKLSLVLCNERGRKWTIEGDCCAPFLSGACMLVRRAEFLEIGGFDPNIFLFYEDDDLCARVVQAGRSLVHVDAAVVRHLRGKSSAPKRGRARKVRFHMAWSRLYIVEKWGLHERVWPETLIACTKLVLALASFDRRRIERFSGTIAGTLAHLRGRRAIDLEGLDPPA